MKYFIVVFSLCFIGFSQDKKSIRHEDYDLWKRISSSQLSPSGKILVNEVSIATGRGDGYLQIDLLEEGESVQFFNGTDAKITNDEKYIVFMQKPVYDSIRAEKKREVKKENQAKPWLKIYSVAQKAIIDSVSRVKKFYIPEEADAWVVIEKHKDEKEKASKDEVDSKKEKKKKKKKKSKEKEEAKSKPLNVEADYAIVYDLSSLKKDSIFQVDEIELVKEVNYFYFSKTQGKKKPALGVYKYDIANLTAEVIDSSFYRYQKLSTSKTGKHLAFYAAKDSTEKDSLKYELLHFNQLVISKITDTTGINLREDWQVSTYQKPSFSEDESRL